MGLPFFSNSKRTNVINEDFHFKNKPIIFISKDFMESMEDMAWNATDNNIETGGYFFGYRERKDNYFITSYTGPGNKAIKSSARFIPDADELQKEFDVLNKDLDIYWIGSWHVHPRNFCDLSATDINSMSITVNDPECLEFFIAMVFSAYNDKMHFKAFMIEKGRKIVQATINTERALKIDDSKEDCLKSQSWNDNSLRIKKLLESKGFLNLSYEIIDHYHLFKGLYEKLEILLCIPINRRYSPSLFVNDKLFFVPINWNDLCTVEDFIDCIELSQIRHKYW